MLNEYIGSVHTFDVFDLCCSIVWCSREVWVSGIVNDCFLLARRPAW